MAIDIEEPRCLSWYSLSCSDWNTLTCDEIDRMKCGCCVPLNWEFTPTYDDPQEPKWTQLGEWEVKIAFADSTNCYGPSNITQRGTAERGFVLLSETELTVALDGMIEHQNPHFDLGRLEIIDCCTEETVLEVQDESDGFGGGCNMVAHTKSNTKKIRAGLYKIRCTGDTFDALFHEGAYWKFKVTGLNDENRCSDSAPDAPEFVNLSAASLLPTASGASIRRTSIPGKEPSHTAPRRSLKAESQSPGDRALGDRGFQAGSTTSRWTCRHRGSEIDKRGCNTCGGSVQIKVFGCELHGQCTLEKRIDAIATCAGCPDRITDSIQLGLGVLTAPRTLPTLAMTIESLRAAGFGGAIHIFAEPESSIPNLESTVTVVNQSRLGPLGNWLSAAKQLLDHDKYTHLLICEDDVGFVAGAERALVDALQLIPANDLGYVSLYTPIRNWESAGAKGNGWHRLELGRSSRGGWAYCVPAAVARKLVNAAEWVKSLERTHTDLAVSSALHGMGLGTWFHNPSWAFHTGVFSTVGHSRRNDETAIGLGDRRIADLATSSGRMAVVTARFNPAGYELPRRHYRRFAEALAAQSAPLYTVSIAFGNADHECTTGLHTLQLHSESVLWQKERALNEIIRRLPRDVDTIAWIDADILFEDARWYDKAQQLLRKVPLVQLFDRAHLLNRDERVDNTRHSVAYAATHGLKEARNLGIAHPGFAWAARRSLLEQHGLYDAHVVGGGDSAMTCAAFGWFDHPYVGMLSKPMSRHYLEWGRKLFADVRGYVAYAPVAVRHLWHGERSDRRYVERTAYLRNHDFDPAEDLRLNDQGCWEWASDKPELHRLVRDYFFERMEDGSSASQAGRL